MTSKTRSTSLQLRRPALSETRRLYPYCPADGGDSACSGASARLITPVISRGKRPAGRLCVDLSDPRHRLNLRLDTDGTTLRSAGSLVLLSPSPGHSHVEGGLFSMADGEECHIVYRDGTLLAYRGVAVSEVAHTDASPRFVLPTDDGNAIIVMPREGKPMLYRYDSETEAWSEGELFPELPAITLARYDMETVSVPLPSLTLKGTYDTTSRALSPTDADAVADAMTEAYKEVAGQAAVRGLFLQPVVARYRLRTPEGRVVYTSAPVMISAPTGFQATTARLELSGEGSRRVSASPLTATLFTVGSTFSAPLPREWARLLKGVEILVSPQLHPFVESMPSLIRHVASSATVQTFSATLPGTDREGSSTLPSRAVPALLDNEDDSSLWTPLSALRPLTLKEETDMIDSLLRTPAVFPDDNDLLRRRLSAPHSFTAGCGARNGDLVAWGNLEAIPFDGYSPAEMVIGRGHSEWPSCPLAAAVTLADGSVHVRSITLSNTEVASFSPLLTYPSPDAVQLTLIAGKKTVTVDLKPSPSGRYSYWVATDPSPLTPGETLPSFVLPATVTAKSRLPGAVMICEAAEPLRPLAVSLTDSSTLTALHATPRLANSLNSAESRFYALGTGGVYSLSPALNRSRLRVSCIDRRPLLSPRLSTEIPGGIAALLDGSLVSFAGTRVSEILSPCEAVAIAWNSRRSELWLSGADTPEALVTDLRGTDCWRRLLPSPGAVLSSSGSSGRILTADGHIYDLNAEGTTGGIAVALRAVMICHDTPGRASTLSLPLYGSGITGSVTLSASHHPADAVLSSTASASAQLLALKLTRAATPIHPIAETFIMPHCHYLTLGLELFGSAINLPLDRS